MHLEASQSPARVHMPRCDVTNMTVRTHAQNAQLYARDSSALSTRPAMERTVLCAVNYHTDALYHRFPASTNYPASAEYNSSLMTSSSAITGALDDLNEDFFTTEPWSSTMLPRADCLSNVTSDMLSPIGHRPFSAGSPCGLNYNVPDRNVSEDYEFGSYGHSLPQFDFNSYNHSTPAYFNTLDNSNNMNDNSFYDTEEIATTPTGSDIPEDFIGSSSMLDWSLQAHNDPDTMTHEMTFKDLLTSNEVWDSPPSSDCSESPNSYYDAPYPSSILTNCENQLNKPSILHTLPVPQNSFIINNRESVRYQIPQISTKQESIQCKTLNQTLQDSTPQKSVLKVWEADPLSSDKLQAEVVTEITEMQEAKIKPREVHTGDTYSGIATKHTKDTSDTKDNEVRLCRWVDCNAVFYDRAALSRHIERAHVDQRRGDDFTCFWAACPRKRRPFNARYKLLIHMRVHSGERPNRCTFPGCGKAFSRLENLKIHHRSHTGERPYVCGRRCGKAFSNSSDRAKHQRTHLTAKPYACSVPRCHKSYTDPSSLRKHVKNHSATDQLLARTKMVGSSSDESGTSKHGEQHRSFSAQMRNAAHRHANADADVVRFSLRCHLLSRQPCLQEVVAPLANLPQEDLDTWIN